VQVRHRGTQLPYREIGMLQRHGADADEAVWSLRAELGDRLVGERRDALGEVSARPGVRQRHRAHRLDVHTGLVHRGDPGVHIGQANRQ
jgi:hypothetical protein